MRYSATSDTLILSVLLCVAFALLLTVTRVLHKALHQDGIQKTISGKSSAYYDHQQCHPVGSFSLQAVYDCST